MGRNNESGMLFGSTVNAERYAELHLPSYYRNFCLCIVLDTHRKPDCNCQWHLLKHGGYSMLALECNQH